MVQFVGLLDAEGTVLEINSVALEAVGVKLSDVEGKPFWTTFWWQVSEEINLSLRESIVAAAQGEFVRWDTPIYGRAGGKETIIIDASLYPVKDAEGKVVFICAEGRDITEKKAQEREIAQKNLELQGLLERIRELDDIKTQFFANVSHELRTPLALIIGPAERLISASGEISKEMQRDTAQTIVRNAKMLLKHVNDLLDISKLEANKLKIELQEIDVAELIRFVASHFELLAKERQINFHIETASSFHSAVDREKLQRVIMNLLSNAFKFVPAGGIVRCKLEMEEKDIRILVEDSGPGIKPELRKIIFERFRQGDGATNRQFAGTGLGLAIAHEFVEMHKGTIEVLDSKLGGALFKVNIPITHTQELNDDKESRLRLDHTTLDGLIEELRLPSPQQHMNGLDKSGQINSAVILIVEDNAEMNKFIAQSLENDYHVISAFDGHEGLQKAIIFRPALIVTDIMMPRVSGVEMIAELRKRPEMADTPILLLSAKADEELKLKLLEESAQDFITKPFSERDLQVRIKNLLTVKRSQEVLKEAESKKRQAVETMNKELQMRSKQLSELFEQAPSFMAVLRGPNHVFELANVSYYKLIGQRDIIGKSIIEAIPEFKDQGYLEMLDNVFATGQPASGTAVPVLLKRKDELEQRYVSFVYQPLFDAAKNIVGIFAEGHDVTDQKRAEDALRIADRRKDEFLATLAHELRNPLAPIRHASMINQGANVTENEMKRSHEVIVRQVEHMGRLLDDLLDVSRITNGKLELRKERLSVNDSLIAAVETARPLIESRGHKLEIEIPSVISYIDADPVRFEQIFSNLLSNAAKYTDRGGTIKVRAKIESGSIKVTVKDNGIGISTEQMHGVFEMFSQATSAIERSEGGLGIGLALVRGLVLLHGGSIEGFSEGIGKGSEFTVSLPLAYIDHGSMKVATNTINGASHNAKRILIVDDNRDNADLCSILLKKSGHEVHTAYSGKEGLIIAEQFRPNVILLDIGMPVMNGYDVARKIREMEWGKNIVLFAITGWGQEEDKRQAITAGFDHHITKPFDVSKLEQLLS